MADLVDPEDLPEPREMPVQVIRSKRRKKSSAARVVDGVIEVRIPSWMTAEEEREAVEDLVTRVQRAQRVQRAGNDLELRARTLAAEYDLPLPAEIKWVTNQNTRWGSCSIHSGVIRISSRLADVPAWVLDFVILHEMTHLVEAGHGPEFHALMDRYPRCERAEGFLDAMVLGCAHNMYIAP